MKSKFFFVLFGVGLLALPAMAWADRNPDFDADAKPILRMQPGLLEYVEERFEVKGTGKARVPGNDEQPPQPPYMFKAKPRGNPGPYTLMLLIQPGPANHILNVVDMTRVQLHPATHNSGQSYTAAQPAPQPPASPSNNNVGNQAPETANQPVPTASQAPTADTPSGPIPASSANQTAPSLEPPADPAPPTH